MRIIKAACIICSISFVGASSSQRKYDSSTLSYDPKVLGIRYPESRGLQCSLDSFVAAIEAVLFQTVPYVQLTPFGANRVYSL